MLYVESLEGNSVFFAAAAPHQWNELSCMHSQKISKMDVVD
jgi:hypothetical protein